MYYGTIKKTDIADGPGIRVCLYVSGCRRHCKGCHNVQSQSLTGGLDVNLRVLYDEIKSNPLVSGVTFSGGEPFIQPEPLTIFAKILKAEGYSIWAYTGFTYDKLITDQKRLKLLEYVDVLVDGPFVLSLKSLDLDFRGSSNQRLINVKETLAKNSVVLMEGYK